MDHDTSMYKGNTDSTISSKLCVRCLCMYALFYIFVCGFDTKKGLYIKKSFEMCICSEFDRPEMTLCGCQDVQFQLLPASQRASNFILRTFAARILWPYLSSNTSVSTLSPTFKSNIKTQHTRELISARKTWHKYNNKDLSLDCGNSHLACV